MSVEAAPAPAEAAPAPVEAAPAPVEAAPAPVEAAPAPVEAAPVSAEAAPAPVEAAPAPAPVDPALAPTEPMAAPPSTAPASAEAAPIAPSAVAPTVRIVAPRLEPADEPAPTSAVEAAPAAEAAPIAEAALPAEAAPTAALSEPPPPEPAAPVAVVVPTSTAPTRPMRAVTPDGMPALARPHTMGHPDPGPEPEPPADEGSAAPQREAQAMISGELASPALAAAPVAPADDADTVRGKRPSDGLATITIEADEPKELPPVIVELDRGATPIATVDEPSDGVIRQTIASAETARTGRRGSPPPGSIPIDDRPEDATGEIVTRTGRRDVVAAPSDAEPSILVADLAEAHTAVAAVATEQAAAPAPPTMATPVTERVVAEVSGDAATAFTDLEEDFFRAGADKTAPRPAVNIESFDDLDEGYQPVGFWDRLLGRKPKR